MDKRQQWQCIFDQLDAEIADAKQTIKTTRLAFNKRKKHLQTNGQWVHGGTDKELDAILSDNHCASDLAEKLTTERAVAGVAMMNGEDPLLWKLSR